MSESTRTSNESNSTTPNLHITPEDNKNISKDTNEDLNYDKALSSEATQNKATKTSVPNDLNNTDTISNKIKFDYEDNKSISSSTNETLKVLTNYDQALSEGAVHSEVNETVILKDLNNTDVISATTKLDDVSNLDIEKEKRKQRKVERKEKEDINDKPEEVQLVDTIVVKGSVLQGQIDQLTAEYLSFKLIYGQGSIRINYSDVESLVTEHEYHIYFDGKETLGSISGIKDHAFLLIQHGEVEELITISKIDRFIVSETEDNSIENRLRNTFPYWSGNADLGLEYENGTNQKRKIKLDVKIQRKRAEFKTILLTSFAFEVTQTSDTPEVVNKKELYSFLEQDYAFSEHDLLFAEIGYDFDEPRYVDNRLYPSAGYGYRLQTDKNHWIQFKVGAGYVFEQFLASNDNGKDSVNTYATALFAVDTTYKFEDLIFIDSVLLSAYFFYMPGLSGPDQNWLLRYSLTGTIPLSKSLAFKMVAKQITDDNPAPDVGNNKFTFDLYLSLRF